MLIAAAAKETAVYDEEDVSASGAAAVLLPPPLLPERAKLSFMSFREIVFGYFEYSVTFWRLTDEFVLQIKR